jgi:uncharacterized protein YecA (UPF0149 family)
MSQAEAIAQFRKFQLQALYDKRQRAAGLKDKLASAKRNGQCPCGSGRKFKRCCWGKLQGILERRL